MAKSEKHKLAQTLIDSINEIASISDHHTPMKKHCGNLSRRLKLLIPMLEEIRDNQESSSEVVNALLYLKESLVPAKDLLAFVSQVSKIYLVCEYFESINLFLILRFLRIMICELMLMLRSVCSWI